MPTLTPTVLPGGAINVQITSIHNVGLVTGVESDEYVEITNLGYMPHVIAGWVLKNLDDEYPSFTFPSYIIEPDESIRVYTNEIHSEWGGFSFEFDQEIWSNTGPDTAILYNEKGQAVSMKSY